MPTTSDPPAARKDPTRRGRARSGALISMLIVGALSVAGCGASSTAPAKTSTTSRDALITAGLLAQTRGDAARAASLYATAVAVDHSSAIALYDLADVEQVDLHEDTKAIADYEKALAIEPGLAPALFNLAILETEKHPALAALDYRRLLGFDTAFAAAHLNYGYVLISLGEKEAGKAQIATAVRLDPALKNRPGSTPVG